MQQRKASLLTGTPGIGKVCDVYDTCLRHLVCHGRILNAMSDLLASAWMQSWFLQYVIWKLQQEEAPPNIVWYVPTAALCYVGTIYV
jgi:hypothetical protein